MVEARYDGRVVTVTIDGAVGPALRAATAAGLVLRVNPVGDDLEELFLSFYEPTAAHTEVP